MGLDMYLYRQQYVHQRSDPSTYQNILAAVGITGTPESPHLAVAACVAYWRKANAIHKWFVDKCQDGVDECQETWVGTESLIQLREVCKTVLADMSKAAELLPTESGFFFGGTDYDEYYYDALTYTADQIDKLLDPKYDHFDFEYHSSW